MENAHIYTTDIGAIRADAFVSLSKNSVYFLPTFRNHFVFRVVVFQWVGFSSFELQNRGTVLYVSFQRVAPLFSKKIQTSAQVFLYGPDRYGNVKEGVLFKTCK